jgi:hypothetical protein
MVAAKEFIKNCSQSLSNILRNKENESAEVPSTKSPEFQISTDIDKEINSFLSNRSLPTDADITDYAKYLTMKYGGNVKSLEKDIIEKVKQHVKDGISRKTLKSEIHKFLARCKQPDKKDMDDFVKYINLLKLDISETEVREEFEKERLYRKFHEPQEIGSSELDQFINVVKTSNDKDAVAKLIQKQGLSYLIKDENGISDQSISDFVDLMAPNENDMKDALEGMGLKHLIIKK